MAKRRMLSNNVIDTDAFMDLPLSAQALYFHLCLKGDDDGFIPGPRRIAKLIGASDDDLRLLLYKRFILAFDDGVIVIKHWRLHNTIKNDRYTPTAYQEDLKQLSIKDNGAYTMTADEPPALENGTIMEPERNQNGAKTEPQYSIDKYSIDKYNLNIENEAKKPRFSAPAPADVAAYCAESGIKVDADAFCDYYGAKGWKVGSAPMKDWKAAARNWARRDAAGAAQKPAAAPAHKNPQAFSGKQYAPREDEHDDLAELMRKSLARTMGDIKK